MEHCTAGDTSLLLMVDPATTTMPHSETDTGTPNDDDDIAFVRVSAAINSLTALFLPIFGSRSISSKHCTVVFSHMSMQSFRGVPRVTSQDEETGVPFMVQSRGARARNARAFKIGPAPCRYGSNCWRPGCVFNHGDCPERMAEVSALADFWRSQSVRESTDQGSQVRRDISQLRGAVRKLAAKIMWNSAISRTTYPVHRQSDGHSVVEYAVENPTVSEQVVVSKIPEVPAMKRIQEQIVESIKEDPQERVQQRRTNCTRASPYCAGAKVRTGNSKSSGCQADPGKHCGDHSTGACSAAHR